MTSDTSLPNLVSEADSLRWPASGSERDPEGGAKGLLCERDSAEVRGWQRLCERLLGEQLAQALISTSPYSYFSTLRTAAHGFGA